MLDYIASANDNRLGFSTIQETLTVISINYDYENPTYYLNDGWVFIQIFTF